MPLSDLFAAVRWWFILTLIGAAATPLTLVLLRRLPDRGYAFARMVGLLIASYLFWMLGSIGFLGNDVGGMLFSLFCLFGVSVWAWRKSADDLKQWLREHGRYVAAVEILFLVVFGLWVWVRAQNPAITATEKPMEFAFLNAIGRSPTFPPLDPWLSGYAISYYYFGYVMTSMIARLALVAEPVAFNLGIAWLVAGTAVAAFGLVYNLVATQSTRRRAMALGLVAAMALPVAGNLEIALEIMHANGIGSASFWRGLDVRDLNGPAVVAETPRYETTSWWWWRSSRVIHEYHLSGRAEEGLEPIAEFPGFSFVLGDMHPHVLALPFAFLSLAVAFSWWLQFSQRSSTEGEESWETLGWSTRLQSLIDGVGRPLWLFSIVVLGGLSFLNTWDVLIHLFVVLGAFALGNWRRYGWHNRILTQTALMAVLLMLPAVLLYLPFYFGFRSQAGPPFLLPMLMRPTRLTHFLVIFGMPVWSIAMMLIVIAARQRFRFWRAGVVAAVGLAAALFILMLGLSWIIASSNDGAGRVVALAEELDVPLPVREGNGVSLGWGLSAVLALAPDVLGARIATPGLTLMLSGLIAVGMMAWFHQFRPGAGMEEEEQAMASGSRRTSSLPFVILLVITGALLTIGPEFVYLRDNFGMRLNTVFKFYYQAWVMLGAAALFALDYLWRKLADGPYRLIPVVTMLGYGLMLAVSLLFPYYAIRSRAAEYRGSEVASRLPATLDGLAQMGRFNPDEHHAVRWLREHVSGTPVILEAVGGQYSSFARVSASTGLPTVLGWAGHELQWRGSSNPEPGIRDPVVRQIYAEPGWERTAALLEQYDIEYIYVGAMEHSTYGPRIRDKFDGRMAVAFANDGVTIYKR